MLQRASGLSTSRLPSPAAAAHRAVATRCPLLHSHAVARSSIPAVPRSSGGARMPARIVVSRAQQPQQDDPPEGGTLSTRMRKMVESLQEAGLIPAKAKSVLKAWSELGAQDPEKLRKLLVERRLKTFQGLLLQTLLDFVACGGGFYIGRASSESNIPGSIVFSLIGYFLACYYFLQAAFQLTALASISVAAKRYSTDTDVLLAAVRELAGPEQSPLFPSAALVVNTLKVIQTLEQIGEQLQTLSSDGSLKGSSLANLSALLTLQRAEEQYGFEPSKFGLTEAEAADIAGVFARFDVNEDGRLEASEIRSLCSQLGTDISEAEAKEAVRVLDGGSTGFVQFDVFVEWWQGIRPTKEAKEAAASASSSQ